MFRVAFNFLCVLVLTNAQIPSLGFCPEYLPMADFEMEKYLGKWYEAERYFQFSEVASRCVVTDYAKAGSGKIYVSNEVTNRLTGIKRVIDGHVELAGRQGEGKINVRYSTTPIATETQLTVLDTDYDSYAVVWSCSGLGPVHAQSVWVMTRDRLAAGPVMQKAYGVLDKFKISRNFFVKTDQEGCAIAASDINAANGITSISTVAEATGTPQRKIPIISSQAANEDIPDKIETNEIIKARPVVEIIWPSVASDDENNATEVSVEQQEEKVLPSAEQEISKVPEKEETNQTTKTENKE